MSSQFAPGEIGSILLAWVVLSIGWTYSYIIGLLNGSGTIELILAGFIATATGFILHEMGHKFVAIRRGYVAHFRLWTWGLLLTIGTVVLSGGNFLLERPARYTLLPRQRPDIMDMATARLTRQPSFQDFGDRLFSQIQVENIFSTLARWHIFWACFV